MKIQSVQLALFRKKYTAHGVLLRKEWAAHGTRLTSGNAVLKGLNRIQSTAYWQSKTFCEIAWLSDNFFRVLLPQKTSRRILKTLQQSVCSLDIFLLWIIRLFPIDAIRVIRYPLPISRWNTNMTWRRLALVVDVAFLHDESTSHSIFSGFSFIFDYFY